MEESERFAALMARPEGAVDLDEMALLIAAHANPRLDVAAEQASLDVLAQRCRTPTLDGLRAHLFVDEGFAGDRATYHDPRNSYLDEVLRRRRGIPISLAVLTISVGRRLGVPLHGVGMPGHFLVGDAVDDDVFLDGFNGGVLIDTTGCERLFRSLQGADAPFHPSYLQPVGAHAIGARMLANLRAIFGSRRDVANLVWVLRLRAMIPGVTVAERAELASVLMAGGDFGGAADVLADLAATVDDPVASASLAQRADQARSRLN